MAITPPFENPVSYFGTRAIPFQPYPGKYGYVEIDNVRINVCRWSPNSSVSINPTTTIYSDVDDNEIVHSDSTPGICNTSFTITGFQDGSTRGYHPTPGQYGSGKLGYGVTLFYNIDFFVVSVGGDCMIDGVSGLTFTIQAYGNAAITHTSGSTSEEDEEVDNPDAQPEFTE